jgi:protein-S-isoprenylcysteine O-methyltransferase Ste14
MSRIIALAYGLIAYALFLATILYAIGFVGDFGVPKGMDAGRPAPLAEAFIVNIALLFVFAIQHSLMARPAFKRWWTQFVPKPVERSTYVIFASSALLLVFWQWRPMTQVVWSVTAPAAVAVIWVLFWAGWAGVFLSTFLINHFDLFGLKQVWEFRRRRDVPEARFMTPLFYQVVRHPLYLGFIIAFWAAPTMTAGHLLFATVTTTYILFAIRLEERDLIDAFGGVYVAYRKRVPMLLPMPQRPSSNDSYPA